MSVIELWWLSLAIAAIVVAVVAILLGLIIATAKSINDHAEGIWTAGKQIAGNTVAIWMLEQTKQRVIQMQEDVSTLAETATAMDQKLQRLAERGRR